MIPLLLYAQAIDLVTFTLATTTLGFEGNEYGPYAVVIYPHFGLAGVLVGKIAAVASFVYAAFAWRHTWLKFTRILAILGIVIGTIGMLTNVVALAVMV